MNICPGSVILFCLFVVTSSPSSPPFTMAKLGESAVLACQGTCSGSAQWIMGNAEGRAVARCDQTKCRHDDGFNISHAQYLEGDLRLTVTAADYRKRTWYTCQCDGKVIRRVYLRIERTDSSRQLEHGDSFSVEFFISERVKITFNRTADDGSQKSVLLYESSENKVHYHPDWEQRALSKSCFILNDVSDSDSGVYTVWDADNDELIATHTLAVTGNTTKTNQTSLPEENRHFWRWMNTVVQGHRGLVVGLGLGLLLAGFFIHIVFPRILKAWTWLRSGAERSGADGRTAEKQGALPEHLHLVSG